MLSGLSYLLLYNFVFVLPLIVILFLATQKEIAEKMGEWQRKQAKAMRLWTGAVMVGLGIIILGFFV
jgi:cytochrome c biogenesis protein CcdA